jgi:hypothetical protein
MATRVPAWLGLATLLWLVGACGKSTGDAEEIPRDELPSRIASLLCQSIGSCCQRAGFPIDMAECKRVGTAELEEELLEEQEPGVTYDAQAAGDCLASVGPQLVCGDVEDDVPACERIFRGSVALGQPCTSSRQCKRSEGQRITCTGDDGVNPPVCTELEIAQRGKQGEACNGTCYEGEECVSYDTGVPAPAPGPGGTPVPAPEYVTCYRDDGLYCNSMGACEELVQHGFACTDYAACAGGSFCDFQTQLCSAPRDNGAPCQGDNECRSGICSYNDISGTCVAEESVTSEQCASVGNDEPPSGDSAEPLPDVPMPGMP